MINRILMLIIACIACVIVYLSIPVEEPKEEVLVIVKKEPEPVKVEAKVEAIAVPVKPGLMSPWSFSGSRFSFTDPKKKEAEKERLKAYKFEDVEMTFMRIGKTPYYTSGGKVYIILSNGNNSSGSFIPMSWGDTMSLTINGQKVTSENHTNEIIKSVSNPNDRFIAGIITAVEIPGIDPEEFKVLKPINPRINRYVHYFTHKNDVYFLQHKIEGADAKTFESIELYKRESRYSKDKNHVYVGSKLIPGADPETFKYVRTTRNEYSRAVSPYDHLMDDKHVYTTGGKLIEGADPKTYEVMTNSYQKDKDHYFSREKKLDVNEEKFALIEGTYWAKDDEKVFNQGNLKKEFDAKTFEVLSSSYVRDKDKISDGWHVLKDVDRETFEVFEKYENDAQGNRITAKDKHGYFSGSRRIKVKAKEVREYKWPNGKLQSQTPYKDNKKHGLETRWYDDGTVCEKTNWKNGKKHGTYTRWNKEGKKEREYLYVEDVADTSRTYHKNGQLRHESHGKGNNHQGHSVTWFENGDIDGVRIWKDGVRHGIYRYRDHKTFHLTEEGTYVNGKMRGILCEYNYKDGTLENMVFIKENGKGTKIFAHQIDIRSQYATEIKELRDALDAFEKEYEGR